MTIENLNILKSYLSEDEIKEIVINEYKSLIKENIKETLLPSKRIADYERVISNSVFYYLNNEVDSILNTDTKDLIARKTKQIVQSENLSHNIFRVKGAWDTEDSIGTKYLKEAVTENKQAIYDKVAKEIENINFSLLKEDIKEYILEVIDNKLKS